MLTPGTPAMLAAGFLLAGLIGLAAWRMGALTPGGALGAMLIGGLVFGLGGLTWAVTLVSFFVGGSRLSRLGGAQKAAILGDVEKAGPRDLVQTLANGGVAALMALAVGLVGRESPCYPCFTLAFLGSLAAASADTWATELGVLSKQQPRLITTGEETPRGFSGGVTRAGLLASLAGGLFIGLTAFITIQAASLLTTGQWFLQDWFLLIILPVAGFAGSIIDSILGATVQRLYYCERCNTFTESSTPPCRHPVRLVRGVSWVNNDAVNFIASCAGASMAILASLLL